jgi:hypothetical protein
LVFGWGGGGFYGFGFWMGLFGVRFILCLTCLICAMNVVEEKAAVKIRLDREDELEKYADILVADTLDYVFDWLYWFANRHAYYGWVRERHALNLRTPTAYPLNLWAASRLKTWRQLTGNHHADTLVLHADGHATLASSLLI